MRFWRSGGPQVNIGSSILIIKIYLNFLFNTFPINQWFKIPFPIRIQGLPSNLCSGYFNIPLARISGSLCYNQMMALFISHIKAVLDPTQRLLDQHCQDRHFDIHFDIHTGIGLSHQLPWDIRIQFWTHNFQTRFSYSHKEHFWLNCTNVNVSGLCLSTVKIAPCNGLVPVDPDLHCNIASQSYNKLTYWSFRKKCNKVPFWRSWGPQVNIASSIMIIKIYLKFAFFHSILLPSINDLKYHSPSESRVPHPIYAIVISISLWHWHQGVSAIIRWWCYLYHTSRLS